MNKDLLHRSVSSLPVDQASDRKGLEAIQTLSARERTVRNYHAPMMCSDPGPLGKLRSTWQRFEAD